MGEFNVTAVVRVQDTVKGVWHCFAKAVQLPFPPSRGLWIREIGLFDRVVWSVKDKKFTAYLPDQIDPVAYPTRDRVLERIADLERLGWVVRDSGDES